VVVQNGKFIGGSVDAGTLFTGNSTVSGKSLSGSLKVYAIGGGYLYNSTVSATFVEGQSISGTATGGGSTATFNLSLEPIYTRPANTTLAGTYSTTASGYTITITSDNAGSFTGSDSDGCTYSGTQAAYDSTHNLYRLTVNVANCVDSGTYYGYSFNDDMNAPNDMLVWILDDPDFVGILTMDRQ